MTKAFDFKALEEKLLAAGLPAVEAVTMVVAKSVLGWLKDSLVIEAASQPLFAIGVPVLAALEPILLAEIDKIAPNSSPA